MSLKNFLKKIPLIKNIVKKLNNQNERDKFVIDSLSKITQNSSLLDAGCGDQRYKNYCNHLKYFAQDFGQYSVDEKKMLVSKGIGGTDGYKYGKLDYICNIWDIKEKSNTFDVILCTEVFEHIPYPIETVKEFRRLLKPGGQLILTAPSNCLRHMDPYFFYTGFSDRWFEKILNENDFEINVMEVIGDYYSWISVELARTGMSHSILAKIMVFPAFIYYYFKKKNKLSINTLCMGYHIVAKKKSNIENL